MKSQPLPLILADTESTGEDFLMMLWVKEVERVVQEENHFEKKHMSTST